MKYELKSISVWAYLKLAVIINFIGGFLLGLFYAVMMGPFLAILSEMPQFRSSGIDFSEASFGALLIFIPFMTAFSMAFFNTLIGLLFILLYNGIAKLTGGLEFRFEAKEQMPPHVVPVETTPVRETVKPGAMPVVEPQQDGPQGPLDDDSAPPPPPRVLKDEQPGVPAVQPIKAETEVTNSVETDKTKEPMTSQKNTEQHQAPVRVRIAPSPSGYLHVGTARMAIANYLYARHTGGTFLIRIEDTDAERSDASLVEPILSALNWLGIESDEPIVYQSKRTELYKEYAKKILESGHGYRCFCTKEQLAQDREEAMANKAPLMYNRRCLQLSEAEVQSKMTAGEPFVIRLKVPEGQTEFEDLVSGKLVRSNNEIEDLIIARSDGSATYNLAVVVDDHDMKVDHVIRGNDHVTNTFKQVLIYRALGWDVPVFGHVPLILRPDKKKVSKRLGDKDVAQYKEEGILPEAMFNFLCLLGWSPKTDREIYTVEELIEIFNPYNFNASNAVFDEEKLEAFNREHIQMKFDHDLAMEVAPMLVEAGYTTKYWLETRWEYLRNVIGLLKSRVRRVSDFVPMSEYFFQFDYTYDEKAEQKNFNPESAELLEVLANRFEQLNPYTHDTIESALSSLAEEKELKKGKLIHPTRLAVSGRKEGPGLYDMLYLLSQPVVVERMRKAVEYIKKKLV